MKLSDLVEMPLSSMTLVGDWSDDTSEQPESLEDENNRPDNSFADRVDRRLMRNPRIRERVAKLLYRFAQPIDLYLWNSREAFFFYDNIDYGRIDKVAWDRLPAEIQNVTAIPDPGKITIVLAHNDGGSTRHPLTPWMVLHRMAHALDGLSHSLSTNVFVTIKDAMFRCYDYEPRGIGDKHGFAIALLTHMCTFKAARDNAISTDGGYFGEAFTDMLVQHLIYGAARFNPIPHSLVVDDATFTLRDSWLAQKTWERLETFIHAHHAMVIRQSVGSAYIC